MNTVFAILLFCSICLIPSIRSQRSAFGEECGKTIRCDRRAWLGCFNGKCDCLKPEEMIYEPSSKKCVSKAGERCKFTVENLDGNTAFELTTCVENSKCSKDGFCSCNEDFQEITNGTCIPSRKLEDSCDEQFKCSSRQGLECQEGTCQCSNTTTFSQLQNQCVGRVGQDCVKTKCTENAFCDLRNNKCDCIKGHFLDWEDKCTPKLGLFKNCTSDDQCMDNVPLKCNDGMCSCDPDVSVLYKGPKIGENYPNAICAGRVNSPCIHSRCVAGASCHTDYVLAEARSHPKIQAYGTKSGGPRERVAWWTTTQFEDDYGFRSGSSEEAEVGAIHGLFPTHAFIPTHAKIPALKQMCVCNEGYTYSKAGTCGKPFGATCVKGECVDGLVCKGNHCTCRYPHQEFSALTLSCRNKIRGPCSSSEECTDNSVCRLYNNQTFGECACKDGYVENMKRECDVQYGGDCVRNTDCDAMAGLVCTEGQCECRGFAKFDKEQRKCLSLVGGDCTTSGTGIVGCIENANCSLINKDSIVTGGLGTCVCNDGFSVSPGYTCEGNDITN